jgi:hypothetical protein
MNSGSYNVILSLQNILSRCLDTKIFSSQFLKETLFLEPWAAARLIICLPFSVFLRKWSPDFWLYGSSLSLSPLYQNKKMRMGYVQSQILKIIWPLVLNTSQLVGYWILSTNWDFVTEEQGLPNNQQVVCSIWAMASLLVWLDDNSRSPR